MVDDAVLQSLRCALAANPEDVPLRLHLAQLLTDRGHFAEAIVEVAIVLQSSPTDATALLLMQRASQPSGSADTRPPVSASQPQEVARPADDTTLPTPPDGRFDWTQAEVELDGIAPPMYVEGGETDVAAYDAERPELNLADVGGMQDVKQRLESAFLAPIRHPELRRAFAKSLRGGLLLYGPPGCGKTFIARALAGELGAHFVALRLNEVLDMWIGASERNLHEVFEVARRCTPCVLFLDEVDAIGQKRSQLRNSAMRAVVNQLLAELDDVAAGNEGIFVLAATNMPWDVDAALRRPGRLDRTLLVLPPDEAARAAIIQHHLRDRPIGGVDLKKLARMSEGYSGADLAHVCETAAECALVDSARTGEVRLIDMNDLESAMREVHPSIGVWLESARNVALFANEGGQYDELLHYLKKRKLA
jgi:SpoVK/Ycf46/Vps4 family AAA+-type ATPase